MSIAPSDRYYVETIWRYKDGHGGSTIRQTYVRTVSAERAAEWGAEALRSKFGEDNIEIVKSTATIVED